MNPSRSIRRLSVPSMLVSLLCLQNALAQSSGPGMESPGTARSLSAVTVTATGYESEAVETPIATTVVERDEIERWGAQNVGDALRNQPGLAVVRDSAQGANPVIRGLGKDSIVLMVDGVRLNSAQPAGAIASFLSLGLAERVEVVKGPASVLYGTGALGGAINVRLPQARFEPGLRTRASLSYDVARREPRAAIVGNYSQDDHAVMLGASLARPGDYKEPDGRVPDTGYDSSAFIGQYRFRLDASQQLRVSVQRHEDKDVWYPGSTRPHPMPMVGSTTIHSPRQSRTLYELGYSRRGAGAQAPDLDVRVYRQEMRRQVNGRGNGIGRDLSVTDVTFATTGADARADWLVHPQHLVSAGLDAWQMKADPSSLVAVPDMSTMPPTLGALQPNQPFHDGKLSALGIYIQDDMQFGRLKILAGLRHDRVKGSARAISNGMITTGLDRSDGATSGSFSALYEVAPLLRPYVSLARGFRAPDLRERYQNGPRQDGFFWAGSPRVAPEKATQLEIGMKGDSGQLEYALGIWRNRISNYITGTQLSGAEAAAACGAAQAAACKQTLNLGRAVLDGVDASVRWQANADQAFSAGFSRIRGKNRDLGEPLFQMPADTVSLGWEGRVAPRWSLDTRALLVRRQGRVATLFTRGGEDATPGYAVLDIGASWHPGKHHTVRLAVLNAGDKRYHDHLAEGLTGREIKAPGRSLFVAWQGEF